MELDSRNLEENEFISCEFETVYNPSLEELKKEIHAFTYCGEIYASEKKNFLFICTFCNELKSNIEEFKFHMTRHWRDLKWNKENFDYDNDPLQNIDSRKNNTIANDTNKDNSIQYTDKITKSCHDTHETNNKKNVNKITVPVHKMNDEANRNTTECVPDDTSRNKINPIHDNEQNMKNNSMIEEKSKNIDEFLLDTDTNDGSFQCDPDISVLSDDDDHSETQTREKDIKNDSQYEVCDKNVSLEKLQIQSNNVEDHSETDLLMSTKNITCDTCNQFFATEENFKSHFAECAKSEKIAIEVSSTEQSDNANNKTNVNDDLEKSCEETVFVESLDLNPLLCRFCHKQFPTLLRRMKHELIHSRELKCKLCKKKFRTKKQFDKHEMIHTGIKRFKCEICNKSFSADKNLRAHMYRHGPKEIKCDHCDKKFATSRDKIRHNTNVHLIIKFPCEICNKMYRSKKALSNHSWIHQKSEKCKICGKILRDMHGLNTHMIRHGEKKYNCDHCDKKFFSISEKTYHERIHTGEKLWQCDQCPKRFSRNNSLKKHSKCHTNKREHLCSVCGFAFRIDSHLIRHMKLHEAEKNYKCSKCQKTFKLKYYLVNHMKRHSIEFFQGKERKMEKQYNCDHCDKKFVTKAEKINHERIHTGEKPFQCNHCLESFRTKTILNQHLKRLTNYPSDPKIEEPTSFECSICQKSFKHKSNLVNHMKTHSKTEYPCTECDRVFTHPVGLDHHKRKHKRDQQNKSL